VESFLQKKLAKHKVKLFARRLPFYGVPCGLLRREVQFYADCRLYVRSEPIKSDVRGRSNCAENKNKLFFNINFPFFEKIT